MKQRILKRIALLLALILLISVFAACGKKGKENKKDDETQEGPVVQRTISPEIVQPTVTAAPQPSPQVTEDTEATGTTTQQTEAPAGTVALAYANANDVNVRKAPSAEGEVLGQVKQGTIIYVMKKEAGNGWSEISYNGQTAYIATHLINVVVNAAKFTYECRATFNADEINIRADGTTDAIALGQANKGTTVNVLKKDFGHGWSMIHFENSVAFVASRFLDFS